MSPLSKITTAISASVLILAAAAFAGDVATTTAETPASTAAVGKKAPDFTLKDTDGNTVALSQLLKAGKTVVLQWFSPGCPFVVRHYEKYPTFNTLSSEFAKKNVVFIGINSANPSHAYSQGTAERRKDWKIQYPVLIDADGMVGKLYGAKTTPHMFIIGADGTLLYNGAIDDDPRDEKPAGEKVNYIRKALNEITAGKPVSVSETQPYGCSVKYAQ